jgi:Protein of unknown function (DUF3261)
MLRLLSIALMALATTSCATIDFQLAPSPEQSLPLAAPSGPSRRIEQRVVVYWPGHAESYYCVLESDRRHIAIAGMNAAGISLFNLDYDGKQVRMEKSPILPPGFSPEQVLRDIQLAYWPSAEISNILPTGWRLKEQYASRRLYHEDKLVYEIQYRGSRRPWAASILLNNPPLHYRLTITTVSHETVPE